MYYVTYTLGLWSRITMSQMVILVALFLEVYLWDSKLPLSIMMGMLVCGFLPTHDHIVELLEQSIQEWLCNDVCVLFCCGTIADDSVSSVHVLLEVVNLVAMCLVWDNVGTIVAFIFPTLSPHTIVNLLI